MKPETVMAIAARCRNVGGWFSLEAALLFAWLDELQRERSISGDIFEIGVHRGRSAILLSHLARPDEALGICDLFGEQGANVSRSGAGDRDIFEANMRRLGAAHDRLRIFATPSSALTPDTIGRRYRFFHIDGGHNADEALGDLRLAAACTLPGAVIAVDDPFRPEWPGVTEAIIRFLDEQPQYTAFAVGFNKLILADSDAATWYGDRIESQDARLAYGVGYPWRLKTLPFVNRPLHIFHVPVHHNAHSVRGRIEQFQRSRPWARRGVAGAVISRARRLLS